MTMKYITGCRAAAEGARVCKVHTVAAYPITPQTGIVESLAHFVADGELVAQMVPVESEHSAMSATVGAALVGARAFTASSSQGLALMHECLFMASGLRLPIVMPVANRSLASPVTIFCDHQDSLPQRDTGWLQLYAENCQEVLDSIILGYKVAEDERVLLPLMVCFDGFYVSHISEPVDIPDQGQVDAYLGPHTVRYPILDIDNPKVFNVMPFPPYFEEFQRDKHESALAALEVFEEAFAAFGTRFGRLYHNVETHRTEDADYVFLGLGSMMGTAREAVDRLRARGHRVGVAKIKTYRPFPVDQVVAAVRGAKVIGILDRDISFGSGGIVFQDVTRALYNCPDRPLALNFIVGLGGRDVTLKTLERCFFEMEEASGAAAVSNPVRWPDANSELIKAWGVNW